MRLQCSSCANKPIDDESDCWLIVTLVAGPDPVELEKHGIHGSDLSVAPNSGELADITKLIEQKKIKVVVSNASPLTEAAKAQEQAATRHSRGKIVLKVSEAPK